MIHPRNPSRRISVEFSSADIENRSNGSVLGIGFFDGTNYRRFTDWGEFCYFLFTSKEKRHSTVYAHNGSGWDWLSLLQYVCEYSLPYTFDTVQNGNKLVCIMLSDGEKTIKLLDSLFLLQSSLDKAAEKYLGERKVALEHLPEYYYDADRLLFEQYLESDCTLLYRVMIAFCSLIYTKIAPIGRLGITLPSTAMKVFTTSFLTQSIGTPSNEQLRTALRLGYTGGRVEVFRPGYHPNVNVYDINSLYPSVMLDTLVPTSAEIKRTTKPDLDVPGIYYVKFRQRSGVPLLLYSGLGAMSGEGWYYSPELRRLRNVGKFDVLEGYQFVDSAVIFRDYVHKLYTLRMTDKDGPLGNVCKLLMNSLYGKFGQKSERSRTLQLDVSEVDEYIRAGCRVDTLCEEWHIYRITENKQANYEHVGIAGMITSESRSRLWEAMNHNTIYCDTDSVHTTDEMETSSDLGKWKLEFSGSGVYCGKKLYALKSGNVEKIRVKGVKVGGKLGCRLTFSDLREVAKGATIACEFASPQTANAVLKGKQSCRMDKKTRKIRNTVDGTRKAK